MQTCSISINLRYTKWE